MLESDEKQSDATDFVVDFRGGKYTQSQKGVVIDSVRARAVGSAAMGWCGKFGLSKSATFSLAMYGEPEATLLAFECARRLHF